MGRFQLHPGRGAKNAKKKLEMVRPTKERCAEKPLFSQMEKRDKRPDLSCRLQRNC
jgi:hypothetical protein